ncbi:sugar transferase [Ekhidna sp.]
MPIFKLMRGSNLYLIVIKPAFDWFVGLILFIITLPLMLLIAIIIGLYYRSNPFFVQQRVGKNEELFSLVKFRSMQMADEELSVSKVGKFIRRTSLDELPQLWNVLKNEMSLVGPRPLLVEYLPFYNDQEKCRHYVKPGITGWAQVNGRNLIDWGKRMELDIYYVKNACFLFDIKILMKTVVELVRFSPTNFQDGKTITFSDYAKKR